MRFIKWLSVVFVLCLGLALLPVQAQTALSPGCDNANRSVSLFFVSWPAHSWSGSVFRIGNLYFEAGDVISLMPSTLIRENLTGWISLGHSTYAAPGFVAVTSSALPNPNLAPLIYTIPTSGIYDIAIETNGTNYTDTDVPAEFSISCSHPESSSADDGRLALDLPNTVVYANTDGIFVNAPRAFFASDQWVSISGDALAEYPAQPEENTLLVSSADGYINIYLLTTGEYQINIGPDAEGKVTVIIFTGLPRTNVYRRDFNVNDILNPD